MHPPRDKRKRKFRLYAKFQSLIVFISIHFPKIRDSHPFYIILEPLCGNIKSTLHTVRMVIEDKILINIKLYVIIEPNDSFAVGVVRKLSRDYHGVNVICINKPRVGSRDSSSARVVRVAHVHARV